MIVRYILLLPRKLYEFNQVWLFLTKTKKKCGKMGENHQPYSNNSVKYICSMWASSSLFRNVFACNCNDFNSDLLLFPSSLPLSEFAVNGAIQCTEIYEYAMSLGNPNNFSVNFQVGRQLFPYFCGASKMPLRDHFVLRQSVCHTFFY